MLNELFDIISTFSDLETFLNLRLVYRSDDVMMNVKLYKSPCNVSNGYIVWKMIWMENHKYKTWMWKKFGDDRMDYEK